MECAQLTVATLIILNSILVATRLVYYISYVMSNRRYKLHYGYDKGEYFSHYVDNMEDNILTLILLFINTATTLIDVVLIIYIMIVGLTNYLT